MANRFLRFLRHFLPSNRQPSRKPAQAFNCIAINSASGSVDPATRVLDFANAAPNCVCELQISSHHSTHPVLNNESVTRFIFSPVHVTRAGKVKPAAFSYVSDRGCSVQREEGATTAELDSWLDSYLAKNLGHSWVGTMSSGVQTLRDIRLNGSPNRVLAIYDTAERENIAHAEIFQTEYVIEDGDRLELRKRARPV